MPALLVLLLWGGAASGSVAPVPPPLTQLTANCSAPTYASDMLVCEDTGLRRLDTMLARLLSDRDPATSLDIEGQEAWFKRSRLCASRGSHAACLNRAYAERLAVLEAARKLQSGSYPWRDVICDRRRAEIARPSDNVIAIKSANQISLSLLSSPSADWTPFSSATRTRRGWTIRGVDGRAVRCTLNQ